MITIRSWSGRVIHESAQESIALALMEAHARDANLAGANLTGADLTDADLTDADLTGAVLTGAVLTGAVLTGAVLTGAVLTGANLTRADLRGADLAGANLTRADLTDADLTDADLTDAVRLDAWTEREIIVDNFAGAGGASTGIEAALGRPVDVAIDHWPEALSVHARNHPLTRHYTDDVFKVVPREAVGGRPVGLAWFSPDCTHHSRAKGGKPRSKKIRGLAWVAVRWARDVRPRVICVENVEELLTWGPLDADGRPIAARAGETFRAWRRKLESYGYVVEHRSLVAADYGVPTTRRRLFVVARCDGQPIAWPEPTHGKGRAKPWRTVAEVIDWRLPTRSIFGRERALAPATLRRIAAGVDRYVLGAGEPFVVQYYGTSTAHPVTRPALSTVTTLARHGLVVPTLVHVGNGEREGQSPRIYDLHKPLGTVVASGVKHFLVAAWIVKHYGGVVGHGIERPLGAITSQDHHALGTASLAPVADRRTEVDAFLRAHGIEPRPIVIDGEEYVIIDLGMRMLAPHELALAQGFPPDYVIERGACGAPITKTDQIALIGNSVCPALAEAVVRANFRERGVRAAA